MQIGLELDPQLMKKNARKSIFISTLSIILPFALGAIVSVYVYELIEEDIDMQGENAVPFSSFLLFLGAAMSITAFPVLARILTERKLIQTRIGVMTMSAAAINVSTLVIRIMRSTALVFSLLTFRCFPPVFFRMSVVGFSWLSLCLL